jgi:hypothetical protein
MTGKHAAKLILQITMGLQSIYWLINAIFYGVLSGLKPFSALLVGVLMLVDGLLFGYFTMFERKWILANDYVLFGFLLVNAVVSITGQMGVFDYVVLGLNLLALFTCWVSSRTLFRRKPPDGGNG